MNNARWIALFVICHFGLICAPSHWLPSVQAQTKVALVDIGLIFKNHPEFTTQLDQLKQQADQFKSASQQIQQQLVQKAEVLKQYEPGSEEFNAAEAQLAKESAGIEVDQRDKMRKMMKAEAQLHYDTYVEVSRFISEYCEQHGIQLVLRYNSQAMEKNNPRTVMQRVNGSIVYFEPHKDITQSIIARIVEAKGTANAPNRGVNR